MPKVLSLIVFSLFTVSGFAQVRTWVSANGLDANPCTRNSPCRNFNAAINAVVPGGEVVVLDSGGYGGTVINKSVSIIVPEGIHAAIAPTSGHALEIAGGTVVIRGLYLNNQGSSGHGIQVNGGGEFFVESTTIDGFDNSDSSAAGINSTAAFAQYHLTDVVIRHCYRATQLSGSSSQLYVDRSRFEQNGQGMVLFDGITAAIRDSLFNANDNAGLLVNPVSAATYAAVERCMFAGNFWGINTGSSGSGATVEVSNSMILSNLVSIEIGPGDAIHSRNNNLVRNNGTTNVFSMNIGSQ